MLSKLLHNLAVYLSRLGIQAEDIQLWVTLLAIGLLVITLMSRRTKINIDRLKVDSRILRMVWLFLAVVLIVLVAFNYFYYSRTPGSWIHRWDMFHSSMNSRYFDELGYFKLYECVVALGSASLQPIHAVDRIRDLNTLDYVDTETVRQSSDCEDLFSETRRAEFVQDLEFWNNLMPGRWDALLKDKGYNGTPFYTFLYQNIIGSQPFQVNRLISLALVDVFLLGLAFVFVLIAYGPRVAFFSFLFFGVNFPNRFVHMGGAILRFDYIALLIIGFCALKMKKAGLAGALMALSTMIRIFPVLFVVGLGIKAVMDWFNTRKLDRNTITFFLIFGGTVLFALLLSLTVGGTQAWTQFMENSAEHNQNTAGFRIGFRHLFMFGGNMFGPDGFLSFEEKTGIFRSHLASFVLAFTLLMSPFILMAKKIDKINFSILFGLLSFYLLFASTRYYYSMLVLPFLFISGLNSWTRPMREGTWLLLFAISAVPYVVVKYNDFAPFIYNSLFSGLLAVFFVVLVSSLYLLDTESEAQ